MQALNFQLDMDMPQLKIHKGLSTSVQGSNSRYHDGTSFRQMLEKAQNEDTRDGQIKNITKDSQKIEDNDKLSTSDGDVDKTKENKSSDSNVDKTKEKKSSEVVSEKSKDENFQSETPNYLSENSQKDSSLSVEILEGDVKLFGQKTENLQENQDIEFSTQKKVSNSTKVENSEILEQLVFATEDADIKLQEELDLSENKIASSEDILFAVMTSQTYINNTDNINTQEDNSQNLVNEGVDTKKVNSKKSKINIIDLRSSAEENSVVLENFDIDNSAELSVKTEFEDSQKDYSSSDSEMTFSYEPIKNGELNINVDLTKGADSEVSKDFSKMLSQEIKNNSNEIIKNGSIILKDGDTGTINLILHPEKLGSVKIKLELSENNVDAKIVVQTEEAYRALKESVQSLKSAFAESGFESSGFDLSFGGQQKDDASSSSKNAEWEKFNSQQFGYFEEDEGIVFDGLSMINNYFVDSRISVLV